ncbi:hypothetical protein GGH92_003622 [Coemansia sp. RSA 2673]|nr:hypothetical protein GGH92_003622 [Coemansia sp. RSA 2673]
MGILVIDWDTNSKREVPFLSVGCLVSELKAKLKGHHEGYNNCKLFISSASLNTYSHLRAHHLSVRSYIAAGNTEGLSIPNDSDKVEDENDRIYFAKRCPTSAQGYSYPPVMQDSYDPNKPFGSYFDVDTFKDVET